MKQKYVCFLLAILLCLGLAACGSSGSQALNTSILFEDEESSEQYGYQVNIGVITCPREEIAALEGSFDVRIELAGD